jgi:hypothetical protein
MLLPATGIRSWMAWSRSACSTGTSAAPSTSPTAPVAMQRPWPCHGALRRDPVGPVRPRLSFASRSPCSRSKTRGSGTPAATADDEVRGVVADPRCRSSGAARGNGGASEASRMQCVTSSAPGLSKWTAGSRRAMAVVLACARPGTPAARSVETWVESRSRADLPWWRVRDGDVARGDGSRPPRRGSRPRDRRSPLAPSRSARPRGPHDAPCSTSRRAPPRRNGLAVVRRSRPSNAARR